MLTSRSLFVKYIYLLISFIIFRGGLDSSCAYGYKGRLCGICGGENDDNIFYSSGSN